MFKKVIMGLCALVSVCGITAIAQSSITTTLSVTNGQELIAPHTGQTIFTKIAINPISPPPNKERAPLNLVLVIDNSSSMNISDRMPNAKKAAISLVEMLSENDSLSLVTFSTEAKLIMPPQKLTNKKAFVQAISKIQTDYTTALYAGVKLGSQQLGKFKTKQSVNRVILLSDGEANVGPSSPEELAQLGVTLAKQGISVSTIGLGLGYNARLMERLASASDGNHVFVENATALETVFQKEFLDASSIVARDATIQIELSIHLTPVRVYGYEGRIKGQKINVDIPQLSAGEEKYIIVESTLNGNPTANSLPVANVSSSYTLLSNGQVVSEKASTTINITKDEAKAKASYNTDVMEKVVLQQAVLGNAQALEAVQKGDMVRANQLLKDNKTRVTQSAAQYSISASQTEAISSDIQSYEDALGAGDVGTAEKQMNQDVYNKSRQKAYK